METNEKKYSNFIGDLKSSNIASNITSLIFYSEQIGLLLAQITLQSANPILKSNLESSNNVISKTKNENENRNTDVLINDYIKFGDIFKSMLFEIERDDANLKILKKIAIHYIDIAKLTKDERIKILAFSIADELSK
ncbi:MAG: hypothetical protein IPM69_13650 [Ignavibacteria bacterium]|nr:hypothetical protein [Ignavibacteria bacterium]